MNEKQIQRCMAYLELARTAIYDAQLRIVGAPDAERPALALSKALGKISAGAANLRLCTEEIASWAREEMEKQTSASTTNRIAP